MSKLLEAIATGAAPCIGILVGYWIANGFTF